MHIFVGMVIGAVVGPITDTLVLSLSFGICLGLPVDREHKGSATNGTDLSSSFSRPVCSDPLMARPL